MFDVVSQRSLIMLRHMWDNEVILRGCQVGERRVTAEVWNMIVRISGWHTKHVYACFLKKVKCDGDGGIDEPSESQVVFLNENDWFDVVWGSRFKHVCRQTIAKCFLSTQVNMACSGFNAYGIIIGNAIIPHVIPILHISFALVKNMSR